MSPDINQFKQETEIHELNIDQMFYQGLGGWALQGWNICMVELQFQETEILLSKTIFELEGDSDFSSNSKNWT